jgi:signal peptidase II
MSSQAPRTRWLTELAALAVTALVVLLADQLTKALIVATVPVGGRVDVLGDLVVISHVQNEGAAFSLFQGGQLLFYVVTVLALAMIVYFQRTFRGRSISLHLVLGLILGGTLGNLVDRVSLGYVTDFVSVGFGNLRWPTFNVADSSIVIGILALVAYLTFFDTRSGEVRA